MPPVLRRLLLFLTRHIDGVLLSAPVLRSAISSSGQSTGNGRQQDGDFLGGGRNAGSRPAARDSDPIRIISAYPRRRLP